MRNRTVFEEPKDRKARTPRTGNRRSETRDAFEGEGRDRFICWKDKSFLGIEAFPPVSARFGTITETETIKPPRLLQPNVLDKTPPHRPQTLAEQIKVVAFDADDTLWHNERIFSWSIDRFTGLVSEEKGNRTDLKKRLVSKEEENIKHFGYGVKGFTLSMIETALENAPPHKMAHCVGEILKYGKEMLREKIELLPGVEETLAKIGRTHRLFLITKGDLFDQENKIARSGLADFFEQIHVVSDKNEDSYLRIIGEAGIEPAQFMMVGNSLKSEVLPVAGIGSHAVHVPYLDAENYLETVLPGSLSSLRFHELESIAQIENLLNSPLLPAR